jgi:hypothetical protein
MDMFLKSLFILSFSFLLIMCQKEGESSTNKKDRGMQTTDSSNSDLTNNDVFKCDYLGQKPPGDIPVKFASGIISTKEDDSCFEISVSGKEMVFNREGKIYITNQKSDGEWTAPTALFEGGESSFSKDGQLIYFNSRAQVPDSKVALNVWYSKKQNTHWLKPTYITGQVLNQVMHAPSISSIGHMYSSGITVLRYKDSNYQKSEKLNPPIKGSHPFISYDDSFIIFDKRPPNGGYAADLYISFHKEGDTWSEPIWLNTNINTDKTETNAFVTPDGKYMFFTRNFDIYWVKADFIDRLK